jgi:hypothetical protein
MPPKPRSERRCGATTGACGSSSAPGPESTDGSILETIDVIVGCFVHFFFVLIMVVHCGLTHPSIHSRFRMLPVPSAPVSVASSSDSSFSSASSSSPHSHSSSSSSSFSSCSSSLSSSSSSGASSATTEHTSLSSLPSSTLPFVSGDAPSKKRFATSSTFRQTRLPWVPRKRLDSPDSDSPGRASSSSLAAYFSLTHDEARVQDKTTWDPGQRRLRWVEGELAVLRPGSSHEPRRKTWATPALVQLIVSFVGWSAASDRQLSSTSKAIRHALLSPVALQSIVLPYAPSSLRDDREDEVVPHWSAMEKDQKKQDRVSGTRLMQCLMTSHVHLRHLHLSHWNGHGRPLLLLAMAAPRQLRTLTLVSHLYANPLYGSKLFSYHRRMLQHIGRVLAFPKLAELRVLTLFLDHDEIPSLQGVTRALPAVRPVTSFSDFTERSIPVPGTVADTEPWKTTSGVGTGAGQVDSAEVGSAMVPVAGRGEEKGTGTVCKVSLPGGIVNVSCQCPERHPWSYTCPTCPGDRRHCASVAERLKYQCRHCLAWFCRQCRDNNHIMTCDHCGRRVCGECRSGRRRCTLLSCLCCPASRLTTGPPAVREASCLADHDSKQCIFDCSPCQECGQFACNMCTDPYDTSSCMLSVEHATCPIVTSATSRGVTSAVSPG